MPEAAIVKAQQLETFYTRLLDASQGHVNDRSIEESLARMLSSWASGMGNLPDWLGVGEQRFNQLLERHFPAMEATEFVNPDRPLDLSRMDEADDLRQLLVQSCSGDHPSEEWIADILVAGCLGSNHLWQDLGFWERADLSKLMQQHFTPLAERNTKDMKWKKFFYKQLCEAEDIFICRSPSCEICVDYEQCFGAED